MLPKTPTGWEEIEKGLGNPCKLRILRALMTNPNKPLTRYMLRKHAGLKAREVQKHVAALVELGWVEEIPYKPTKYRINKQNYDVKRLVEFLQPYV